MLHYDDGSYHDSVLISGDTVEECRELVADAIKRQGWDKEKCWSEPLD